VRSSAAQAAAAINKASPGKGRVMLLTSLKTVIDDLASADAASARGPAAQHEVRNVVVQQTAIFRACAVQMHGSLATFAYMSCMCV
jgi:hypothetical protein